MKKASILFLAILLIGSMLLTSCADAPREGDSEPSASDPTDQTENNSGDNNTEEIQKDSTDLLIFTLQEDDTYSVTGIKDKTVAAELVIPSTYEGKTVTSIGKKAFEECYAITSVTIPDSITAIGEAAFYYCTNLCQVTMPKSLPAIEDYTFCGCIRLRSIVIPNDVTRIGECAFGMCERLTSVVIPDNVTSIDEDAFGGCIHLVSITIGKTVTNIAEDAFTDCCTLVEVINHSSLDITIGGGEYDGYIAYSATEVHTGESKIDNQNGYLFYTYGSTHYLMGYTGSDAVLILPENYHGENYEIYHYAFYYSMDFVSVTIGSGVTSIGEYAFKDCLKLAEVINKSNLTITAGSNDNGYVVENAIEVHAGESKIVNQNGYWFYPYEDTNYLLGYTGTDTVLTLPENYNGNNYEINDYAFYECKNLQNVTIPDSVTAIGNRAFRDCENLMSVTIGSGVTSIGESAFARCDKLVEVINKSALTITAGSEENGLVAYYAIEVHTGTTRIDKVNDYFFYHHSNGTHYLLNYTGFETVLALPENYKGESYEINDHAFYYCENLTSVTIPDSVTAIGKDAFSHCKNLEYKIYDNAKYLGNENNPYLVLIQAKSHDITSCQIHEKTKIIYESAFEYCSNLSSITIPDSVTIIGEEAFYDCSNLSSITIPDSVTSIGEKAFYKCRNLTNATIGNGVTSIGEETFCYCSRLTNITIGDHVTSIGGSAFSECYRLKSVTIPNSVTSIGEGAFSYYGNLTSVVFANTSGWMAGDTAIASDSLADPATAATYLTDTYRRSTWRRGSGT